MNYNEIKKIGLALSVVMAIIVSFMACHKEDFETDVDSLQPSEAIEQWIQQIMELQGKNPGAVIYTTVSNGVFTICDKPLKKGIPRLKAGSEPEDEEWIHLGNFDIGSTYYTNTINELQYYYATMGKEIVIYMIPGGSHPYYEVFFMIYDLP